MNIKELLKEIVDKATSEYEDGETGLTGCLELFFKNELNLDDDDAFNLASSLSDKYLQTL